MTLPLSPRPPKAFSKPNTRFYCYYFRKKPFTWCHANYIQSHRQHDSRHHSQLIQWSPFSTTNASSSSAYDPRFRTLVRWFWPILTAFLNSNCRDAIEDRVTTHFNSSKSKSLAIRISGNYSQFPRYQFPYLPFFGGCSREVRIVKLPLAKT